MDKRDTIMADPLQPGNFDPFLGSDLFDDLVGAGDFGNSFSDDPLSNADIEKLFEGTEDMSRDEYLTAALTDAEKRIVDSGAAVLESIGLNPEDFKNERGMLKERDVAKQMRKSSAGGGEMTDAISNGFYNMVRAGIDFKKAEKHTREYKKLDRLLASNPRPMTPPLQERLQASEAPRQAGEPPSSRKRKGAFVDQLQKTKGGDDYTLVRERHAEERQFGIPLWGTKSGIDPEEPEYENMKHRTNDIRDFGVRQFLRGTYNMRPEDFGDPKQQSRLEDRGLESLRATQTSPFVMAFSPKAKRIDPWKGQSRNQRWAEMRNRYDRAWD